MRSFDSTTWEDSIYARGLHLNRYPFDNVVSFLFRNYPREKTRGNTRVLEVGCGAGNNLWFAAREGFDVTGIDGSLSAIGYARKRFEEDGLEGSFVHGDFTSLPFKSEDFDIVIDRGSLVCCGFTDARKSVDEIQRVLKPNGLFFFNPYSQAHSSFSLGELLPSGLVANIKGGSLVGVGNLCFYTQEDIMEVLKDKWVIERLTHKESRELIGPLAMIHAEWEVVVRKPLVYSTQ